MSAKQVDIDIIVHDQATGALTRISTKAQQSAHKTQAAFDQASKASDGSFKQLGKGAIALGTMFGTLGAQAVVGLGRMAASAVTTGVKTAAFMEQAQIGFTVMMGSAEGARRQLDKLAKFAAATPFEMTGLVDASRTLMGVGVAAKDVIPMLQDFGDTASALALSQDQFSRIMIAVSQSISSNRITLGDMNQLANNGIPIYRLLSESLGMSVPKLRDMISHGKLLTQDVLPKLQAQMHKDYGGAMEKQSQTLNGLWSTLKDTLDQGLGKAFSEIEPVLVSIMPAATQKLGDALGKLKDAFSFVVDEIHTVRDLLNLDMPIAVRNTMTPLQKLNTMLAISVGAVGGFADGLVNGADALTRWKGRAHDAALKGDELHWKLVELSDSMRGINESFRNGYDAVNAFMNIVDLILPRIRNTGGAARSTSSDMQALGAAAKVVAQILGAAVAIQLQLTTRAVQLLQFGLKLLAAAFRPIANAAILTMGIVISSMAAALGWVPGLGPKLNKAAREFNTFAAKATAALNGIPDVTVYVRLKVTGPYANKVRGMADQVGPGKYAQGGMVRAGMYAIVGEEGPELVRFNTPANVMHTARTRNVLGDMAGGGDTFHFHFPQAVIGNDAFIAKTVTDAIRRSASRGVNYGL